MDGAGFALTGVRRGDVLDDECAELNRNHTAVSMLKISRPGAAATIGRAQRRDTLALSNETGRLTSARVRRTCWPCESMRQARDVCIRRRVSRQTAVVRGSAHFRDRQCRVLPAAGCGSSVDCSPDGSFGDSLVASLHARTDEAAKLGHDLAECRATHDALAAQMEETSARAATVGAVAAAAEFGFTPRRNGKDDLLIIEGIGPKINALLLNDGIDTFAKLAAAPAARVQAILTTAGPNFRLANPSSWSQQAAMCDRGAWRELRELQNTLRAGVAPEREA